MYNAFVFFVPSAKFARRRLRLERASEPWTQTPARHLHHIELAWTHASAMGFMWLRGAGVQGSEALSKWERGHPKFGDSRKKKKHSVRFRVLELARNSQLKLTRKITACTQVHASAMWCRGLTGVCVQGLEALSKCERGHPKFGDSTNKK